MSRNQPGPRFIFHGNAMPFGGRIEAINENLQPELIKGPPAAALPVTGGWSVGSGRGGHHRDWFHWGASIADCKGEEVDPNFYRTTVISQLADLKAINDPNVFEADFLRLRIISNHDGPDKAAEITPVETIFDGIRLNRQTVAVHVDLDLASFPNIESFEAEYKRDPHFFNKYRQRLGLAEGQAKFGDDLPRTRGGFVPLSFVSQLSFGDDVIPGNKLSLKGLGNVFFGEVLDKPGNRRVTMVRLEFGCAVKASASAGGGDPNGSWTN